ncbi:hypothetical protein Talka_00965 [Tepidimonas alkaliphilus]|uniref:DUF4390 domain-containing protein n=1 Tax=Tepidimonas alkaliphilus TaxID=2588942 RepID=A0A554W922_9BURK|nr:DUF4390 domain-containing protein [Tepidimonas alkaliphilus]TSE20072.1 hypothetical protein Talka_00965 [Tepidimonas alkaliphilus]
MALLGAWPQCSLASRAEPRWEVELLDDALLIDARVPLELPPALLEALRRGVALTFIWSAEVRRPRWYWTDQVLLSARRTVRLTYQPLTQRWRLSVTDGAAADEHPAALQRVLDTLDEALALVRSSQRWRVPVAQALRGSDQLLLSFALDTGRLPRPLQWLPGAEGAPPLVWRTVMPLSAARAGDGALEGERP